MKYFSGTADEANAMTKVQLAQLLPGGRFYYPMPDYRTPVSIYSDQYLPKKGDMTRVTPAYDYPRYHMMDMGQKFDTACEAGLFDLYANSYLVFWSSIPERLENGEDPIYVKYNKTRKEVFQIKTCICEAKKEGGRRRYVEKAALSLAGSAHIDSFLKKRGGADAAAPGAEGGQSGISPGQEFGIFPLSGGTDLGRKAGAADFRRTASS